MGPAPPQLLGEEAALGGQDPAVHVDSHMEGCGGGVRLPGLCTARNREPDVTGPPLIGNLEGGLREGAGNPVLELPPGVERGLGVAGLGNRHDLVEGGALVGAGEGPVGGGRRESGEAGRRENGIGEEALLDHSGDQLLVVAS